jgi:hypothetical protein
VKQLFQLPKEWAPFLSSSNRRIVISNLVEFINKELVLLAEIDGSFAGDHSFRGASGIEARPANAADGVKS